MKKELNKKITLTVSSNNAFKDFIINEQIIFPSSSHDLNHQKGMQVMGPFYYCGATYDFILIFKKQIVFRCHACSRLLYGEDSPKVLTISTQC